MKKQKIKITHQLEKSVHTFYVNDPDKLSSMEVKRICNRMGVTAILINGRLYNA